LRITSAVFRLAIKHCECSNPLDNVERATPAAEEIRPGEVSAHDGGESTDPDSVLSPIETQKLIGVSRPALERALFETAYLTGAREDELLAYSSA